MWRFVTSQVLKWANPWSWFRFPSHFRATAYRDSARNISRSWVSSFSHPSYLKGWPKKKEDLPIELHPYNLTLEMSWQPRMEFSAKVLGTWFRKALDLRSVSVYMVYTPVLKRVFAELEKLSIGPVCRLKLMMTSASVRFAPATRKSSAKNHWSHTRSQAAPGKQLVLTFFTLTIETTSVLWITTQATLRSTPFKYN